MGGGRERVSKKEREEGSIEERNGGGEVDGEREKEKERGKSMEGRKGR